MTAICEVPWPHPGKQLQGAQHPIRPARSADDFSHVEPAHPLRFQRRLTVVKVIASEVRKGNVLEIDGVLCTVVKAESVRPGKGTPTTHLDVRRISDGVKLNKSYRTTENVERAFLDEVNYNFLYQDDMGYNFMEPNTFEQISISKELIGDQAQWLQENMSCALQL
jgi:elongation factor P